MAISRLFLTDLPVEVLRSIVAPLPRKELKALRQMSRKLCSIASETMFESIAITTNDASYVQLLNVATSEYWSAQVRHIDWVLLDEIVEQKIAFNNPWVTALRNWGIVPWEDRKGDTYYYALELQCQLAQKFTNVQKVHFWNADQSQQFGMEPWEKGAVRSNVVAFNGPEYPDDAEDPLNIFNILQKSKLRPRLVKTAVAILLLEYSTIHETESVEILPHRSSQLQYRGSIHQVNAYDHDKNCFKFLAKSSINTLKILKVLGIWISPNDMKSLLCKNNQLQELHINGADLSTDGEGTEPMPKLLQFLKLCYRQEGLHNLRSTFQEVTCQSHTGSFSATEQQVQAWMEGTDDELLERAKLAFTVNPEYSGSDTDEDEDSDLGDMEETVSADYDFEPDYDEYEEDGDSCSDIDGYEE